MFKILKNHWKRVFAAYLFLLFVPSALPALQDSLSPPLPGWGHEAWFSPAGDSYMLYHQDEGLFLYSTDPAVRPVYLAQEPVAAWDSEGKRAACVNPDQIFIYNLKTNSIHPIPLSPQEGENIVEVVTALDWSPLGARLLYTSLLDYPDQDSDLFLVSVLDTNGMRLKDTIIPNLGRALWLNEQEILFGIYSDMAWERGEIMVWNYLTGESYELLPEIQGGYREIAYNPRTRMLAYAIEYEYDTAIITYNMDSGRIEEAERLLFPIRNIRWSVDNTLFFRDDLHNVIYELSADPIGQYQLQNRGPGFLPAQIAAGKIVYFLSEPLEEPQQLYQK